MTTFYRLLANTTLSSVVNFTVWFAITFFAYLETKSVFATGMMAGVYLALTASSGFWLGSLVDHYNKKYIMLFSSVLSFVVYVAMFFFYIATPAEVFKDVTSIELWILIITLLVSIIGGNIRTIALPTLVTALVPEERRANANGLVGTASGISFLVVAVISGFLVAFGGMFYVLLLAALFTLLVIADLISISIPETPRTLEKAEPKKIDIKGTLVAISAIPGLLALILFSTFNNFLGGVYMALLDPYGLSLVSVEVWGVLWGLISTAFIIGGLIIAKFGLGKNPVRTLFLANTIIWMISSVMTIHSSIIPLVVGMFVYLCIAPFIEASEQTIIQKVVPPERQGRVFGFAQSVEQAASPLTAFFIAPLTQFFFIPFMTTGAGVDLIGSWFGTGDARGMALVFTLTGIIGLIATLIAMNSRPAKELAVVYEKA